MTASGFKTGGTCPTPSSWPGPRGGKVTIKSLARGSEHYPREIAKLEMLGSPAPVAFSRDAAGLVVTLPGQKRDSAAYALKITGRS